MSDRPGGMMIWGIPGFRCPAHVIEEDMNRLFAKCPGIELHLNCAFGKDVTLDELKERHDAVLLTIGAWWGKPMKIDGEDDDRVVDGVSFLRRINGGERPELPETVVVVGGGDVAMDACRSALRMPGCEKVKVVYRRGPDEIPARKDELEGAIKEEIEFVYNTQQVSVRAKATASPSPASRPNRASRTRRRPAPPGRGRGLRARDRLRHGDRRGRPAGRKRASRRTRPDGRRPGRHGLGHHAHGDPKVFAAGDGAFGGSTIVMAMNHGQRAAYYVKQFLAGIDEPLPYRTPYRTRRVPVAQDIMWERFPRQEQEFHGVGENPAEFPEIETGYDIETAKAEAARCYRCDAETGSSDYSVAHREDIFSMARTNPLDARKNRAMLSRRLNPRDNPFPEDRPGSMDDLVFLPANLSRLVIDPYREACRVDVELAAGKMTLERPFFIGGFDGAPEQVWTGLSAGLKAAHCGYVGRTKPGDGVTWLQLVDGGDTAGRQRRGPDLRLWRDQRPRPGTPEREPASGPRRLRCR